MAMTLPARQLDNDPLYFKDPVSCGPHFLRPFATGVESFKESNIITNFHSTVNTTSLDLEVTECQPPAANESASSSSASPHSHPPGVIRPRPTPASYAEILKGGRDSLETLALMNTTESTTTAGTLEAFEEFINVHPTNFSHSERIDVSYRKDGDTPPFRKWMKSFRRKRRITPNPPMEDTGALNDEDAISNIPSTKAGTKTSSSSMRFVTAVKTASNTFASLSIAGGSARRKSSGGTLDDATVMRMRDRRYALEELINTEEYYIADLKVLVNVSFCLHIRLSLIFIEHDGLVY